MQNEKAKQIGTRLVGGILLVAMGFSVLAGLIFYFI